MLERKDPAAAPRRARPVLFASVIALLIATALFPPARAAGDPAPVPAGVEESWWARVRSDIEASEFHVTWQESTTVPGLEGAWHAVNRAQGFRTYFTPQGIRVVPRTTDQPAWEWSLSFVAYGRGTRRCPVGDARLAARENRIEFDRGAVTEWFVNDARGLEHGFVIPDPPGDARCLPAGTGDDSGEGAEWLPLVLDLALSGDLTPVVSADGQAVDFRSDRRTAVHYAHLVVRDARGAQLSARMEGYAAAGQRGIRIVVDDDGAVYPVTVDPLASTPAWTVYGGQGLAHFGFSIDTAGDVNGDGFSDVIVGAPDYDNGEEEEGRAYLYYGSPGGPSLVPDWVDEPDHEEDRFGAAVATAGDVNADGYSDVIVGAPGGDLAGYAGRALVYLGSPTGLAFDMPVLYDGGSESFGRSVSAAGDVNGDGYGDVIVGATQPLPLSSRGRALVFHGSAAGVVLPAAWTVDSDQDAGGFGSPVAAAGDVNGDGFSDVIVGASTYDAGSADEGRAYVFHGSASGLSTEPAWSAEGNEENARFASSLATAGDVNGDGYADVIVGAPYLGTSGSAFVYHGSASGLSPTHAWRVDGVGAEGAMGNSVDTAGDVNADGYADVIVSDPHYQGAYWREGAAFVYLGSVTGLRTIHSWFESGSRFSENFATVVSTAGDVNGDGFSDVLVANEWDRDLLGEEGRASVYLGSPEGLATTSGWGSESDQASASYGYALCGAGDVNGDGYSDIAVAAHNYDNGETNEGRVWVYHGSRSGPSTKADWIAEGNEASGYFGYSVSGAGDVNGDGYDDLIVGQHRHDSGFVDAGRALVFHGSPTGLSRGASWTMPGSQTSEEFGGAVSAAGDVNGDGYADVLVAARRYDGGTYADAGRVALYHGSVSGLGSSAAWSYTPKQAGGQFGSALAAAGDVNRDGYSDIAVAAELYDAGSVDEGQVWVWQGSPSGIAGAAWIAEGNLTDARFGRAVAGAGDVNGDGYSDLLVGVPQYVTVSDDGRVYAYYGSAAGLPDEEDWVVEGGQSGAEFGGAVAGVGDVNGDGFADIAIGARLHDQFVTDGGRVSVYHGSAAGLGSTKSWAVDGGQAGQYLGCDVTSAGDVNGDGYADLLAGSYGYDHGETTEGAAFLYFGNGSCGLDLRPQQRGASDARPVAHLGASDGPDGFRLAVTAKTPFGRGRLLIETEVKPLERLLDGRATEVAVEYADTGPEGTRVSLLESDLIDEKPYHWRMRFRYHSVTTPYAQFSRWMTSPLSGLQEARLRTGDPSAAGRVPGDRAWPGTPLTLSRDGVKVSLSWSPSCMLSDGDYEIYEGTIGSWYSHELRYCSTGGLTTKTLTPLAGNSYYLVVPTNGTREGSYGTDSAGAERPQGSPACLTQQVGSCP